MNNVNQERVWQSSALSYVVWRWAPLVFLLVLFGMMTVNTLQDPASVDVAGVVTRMAPMLAMLGLWIFFAMTRTAVVMVSEGEEGVRVVKGGNQTLYPWHMVLSLQTFKLRSTRFYWMRLQDEPSVLFMTVHASFTVREEVPWGITEIRRHLFEQ